jgi:abortive infection bacteriophage resistance protein
MGKGFIANFDKKVYTETFKNNSVIKNHHRKHPKDAYAPAWKTLEFMTFGSIFALFLSIKDKNIQKDIAKCFNISSVDIFISYIRSIVTLRNTCAHCGVLFDFTLPQSILRGPALKINNTNKNILYPVIQIILFVLTEISTNRANDMKQKIIHIFEKHKENEVIKGIIETKIGYSF